MNTTAAPQPVSTKVVDCLACEAADAVVLTEFSDGSASAKCDECGQADFREARPACPQCGSRELLHVEDQLFCDDCGTYSPQPR